MWGTRCVWLFLNLFWLTAGQGLGRQAGPAKQPALVSLCSILQLLCHFDNGDFLRAAVGRAKWWIISFVFLYNWSVLLTYSVSAFLVCDRSWGFFPPSDAWKLERGFSVFSDHLSGYSSWYPAKAHTFWWALPWEPWIETRSRSHCIACLSNSCCVQLPF